MATLPDQQEEFDRQNKAIAMNIAATFQNECFYLAAGGKLGYVIHICLGEDPNSKAFLLYKQL
jgi:hypothetical protein